MPDWEELPLLSSHVAQRADDAGNILSAGPIDAASLNIDPRVSDFILYGVYNGAFARGPKSGVGSAIGDENPLPDWKGPVQVSGGAITASWVADSSSPSGYNLRFSIAAGAAGDEAYFEQVVPVGGERDRTLGFALRTYFLNSGPLTFGATSALQYLTAAGATTGSEITSTTSVLAPAGVFNGYAEASVSPPANAMYARIRVGMKRGSGATGDSGWIDLSDVRLERQLGRLRVPEQSSPDTYQSATIYQTNGLLALQAPSAVMVNGSHFQIAEVAAPGTPLSGLYAIYPKTDGILYGKNDAGTEVALGGGSSTVIRPSISGTQDNWAPTGLADNCVIIVDLNSANRTITGISALADGAHIELMAQSSTNTITLSHLSGSSSAANQFRLPGGVNYVVGNKAGVRLVYDATDTKWRVVGPA